MNVKTVFHKIAQFLFAFLLVFCMAAILLRPETAFSGVLCALDDCYTRLIPSLFPFMVLSGLLLASPISQYAGLLLYPYTRLLGIKSRRAPLAMLLGILGGFAVCAQTVGDLQQNGEISSRDAALILCCTAGASPAFVISTIGYGMLNSNTTGLILYVVLLLSSLFCGLLFAAFMPAPRAAIAETACANTVFHKKSIIEIIASSTSSMLLLCGIVTIFRFLTAVLLPQQAPQTLQYLVCAFLEVNAGCKAAQSGLHPIYAVCAALSFMSASVFLQIQHLCGKGCSIFPLLLSRLVHMPLSLVLLQIALRVFPYSCEVSALSPLYRAYYRLPPDTMLVIFLFCVAVFYAMPKLQIFKNHIYER